MITCPFCNSFVEIAENKSHNHLYDDEPDDFNCPTQVHVGEGLLESHYARRTGQGTHPEYVVLVMPFSVIWIEGLNKIEVIMWRETPTNSELSYQGRGDRQEFIRIAKKFNNLRAFA